MAAERIAPWCYHNPVKVLSGSLGLLAQQVPDASHILLVTSPGAVRRGVVGAIDEALPGRKITLLDNVRPNPELCDLDASQTRLGNSGIDVVVAIGGGSVLDTAKILALTLAGTVTEAMAAIFHEQAHISWNNRLPLIAIPTTAGTGAEVTPFATIWDRECRRKYSLASPLMFPDAALLDAGLTLTLPEEETLYSGLDAVSHALESIWNRNRTPVSRALAMQALSLAVDALPAALRQPDKMQHRTNMQAASLLAGMAISQTRTAIAHGISYPVTIRFSVPHGLACSFTLPALLRANIDTIAENESEALLFSRVLEMLNGLNLGDCLARYATLEELLPLKAEMYSPGRSDNYDGQEAGGIDAILRDSVTRRAGFWA